MPWPAPPGGPWCTVALSRPAVNVPAVSLLLSAVARVLPWHRAVLSHRCGVRPGGAGRWRAWGAVALLGPVLGIAPAWALPSEQGPRYSEQLAQAPVEQALMAWMHLSQTLLPESLHLANGPLADSAAGRVPQAAQVGLESVWGDLRDQSQAHQPTAHDRLLGWYACAESAALACQGEPDRPLPEHRQDVQVAFQRLHLQHLLQPG